MYFADLFNNNNLLQHFGNYVNNQRNVNSDEFLFNATILMMSIQKIRMLNDLCFRQMQTAKEGFTLKDDKIIVWSPIMVELLTLIPPSLTSLIIMQNKIFPLLQSILGFKQSLPSSLRDVLKNIHKYTLPKPIMQKTCSYWQNGGLAVREYRDIAEHHYELLARSYYQFKPIEKIVIYLPDDPSQKNYSKYTFDKEIECIEYLENSLITICQYVDAIWSDLGFASEAIKQNIISSQIDLEEGVRKTLGVMFYDTEGQIGIEFGQTEERHLFNRSFNYLKSSTDTL